MPLIPVRDIRIDYEMHGSGSRLLYISGTGGDGRIKPRILNSPPDYSSYGR